MRYRDTWRKIRHEPVYAYQRARRGYSEADTWSLHYHLSGVILGGLRRLRERSFGHPSQLSAEEWNLILAEMIAGFEIAAEDSWDAASDPKVKRALALFSEWYFALWD